MRRTIATLLAAGSVALMASTAAAATDDFTAAVAVSPAGVDSYQTWQVGRYADRELIARGTL